MAPRKTKKSVPPSDASDLIQLAGLAAILEQLANPLLDEDDDITLDQAKQVFYKSLRGFNQEKTHCACEEGDRDKPALCRRLCSSR